MSDLLIDNNEVFHSIVLFHSVVQNPPIRSPVGGQLPPQDAMVGGPIPQGFFNVSIFCYLLFSSSISF